MQSNPSLPVRPHSLVWATMKRTTRFSLLVLALGATWGQTNNASKTDAGLKQEKQAQGHAQRALPSQQIDMGYWRISNECAETAAKFWKLAGYHDGETLAKYTNHFNRRLGKCLIRLSTTNVEVKPDSVEDTIYDAVEHVELMDYWHEVAGNRTVFRINGKLAEATPENLARMDALMEQ